MFITAVCVIHLISKWPPFLYFVYEQISPLPRLKENILLNFESTKNEATTANLQVNKRKLKMIAILE